MSLILSGTDGLSDVDGSAATPAIRGTDANTGIFFPAADTIAFAEGGAEAMRLDASGNMGLGVTPSAVDSNYRSLQVGHATYVFSGNNQYTSFTEYSANAFFDTISTYKYKNTGFATKYRQNDGVHSWQTAPFGTAGNAITFTQAMTLTADGSLGVGTTSPSRFIDFQNNQNASTILRVGNTTSGTGAYAALQLSSSNPTYFYNFSNDYITTGMFAAGATLLDAGGSGGLRFNASSVGVLFYTNSTEKARIDSSGNLLVGKTASGAGSLGFETSSNGKVYSTVASDTNSSSTYHVYSSVSTSFRFYVGMGGTVYAVNTSITGISDQRLKENIRDLDDGLQKVMALQPRKFDWKEGKGADIKNARGFIAQEFETVFPDMVEEWLDPAPEGEEPYKAVNANLIPTLVKAIQEQQAIIESLKARLDAANL